MKARSVIIVGLVLAICVLFWNFHGQSTRHAAVEIPEGRINMPSQRQKAAAFTQEQTSASQAAPMVTNASPEHKNGRERLPEIFSAYDEKHNLPIEFYGQVVDQDSKPLADVKVIAKVQKTHLTSPNAFDPHSETVPIEVQTDGGGRFAISNKGDAIWIESMLKEGYETEPNMQVNLSPSIGDFQNPVIFKMWSTKIHEPLITGDKKFQIIPDGRPYFIDLTQSVISQTMSGDLKIWIKYPEQTNRGQLYDWMSEIGVVNGGLLEETNVYSSMLSAPTGGYTNSFPFNQQIKGGQSGSTGPRRFYVMFKNGQEYGRVNIELFAPYNRQISGLVRIQYAINPSGSTILR